MPSSEPTRMFFIVWLQCTSTGEAPPVKSEGRALFWRSRNAASGTVRALRVATYTSGPNTRRAKGGLRGRSLVSSRADLYPCRYERNVAIAHPGGRHRHGCNHSSRPDRRRRGSADSPWSTWPTHDCCVPSYRQKQRHPRLLWSERLHPPRSPPGRRSNRQYRGSHLEPSWMVPPFLRCVGLATWA